MKIKSSIRKLLTYFLVFTLFFTLLQNIGTVYAIGLGSDLNWIGHSCGNAYGETAKEQACCPEPDAKNPAFHANTDILAGDSGPSGSGGILGTIGLVSGILTGNLSSLTKAIVNAAFKYGNKTMTNIVNRHAESSIKTYTGSTLDMMKKADSVDYQCDNNGVAVHSGSSCTCKPIGPQAMIPPDKRIDWNKWIASNTPPDRQYKLASVLGASDDPMRGGFFAACNQIENKVKQQKCLRQAQQNSPKYIGACDKIKDPVEQSKCTQCILTGDIYSGNAPPAYKADVDGETINGTWTGVGCVPADLGKFVTNKFFPFALGLGGAAALLILMYASYLYMTSRGNPEKLKKAKDYMNSGLIGFLLIIFSIFLLQLLGVTILRIPGFS